MAGVMRVEEKAVPIPEDVAVGILKMSPVKSLLRFRCVCKTWYRVISNPEFRNKLHHKRDCVLICRTPNTFATVTIESSLLMNGKKRIRSTPVSLPWQQESEYWFCPKFLGSCNGLVCVDYGSRLILWNPSTRKFKELPSTLHDRNWSYWSDENTYAGFGYEESADDYKFVRMVCRPDDAPRAIEFYVFSLKSNAWRCYLRYPSPDIILSGMSRVCQKLTGVLSNGAIHWVIGCKDQSFKSFCIIAFDLASHNYRLLETPEEPGSAIASNIYVVSLSGCLCLCIHYTLEDSLEGSRIDLWMMKEYGVDSSWLKLISMASVIGFRTFYPILFSNGEGETVAMVKYHPWLYLCSEIVELRVEEEEIVKAETLWCDDISSSVFDDYALLHMEETLFSIP